MFWDHICLLLTLLKHNFSSLCTKQISVLLFFSPIKSNLCCPYILKCLVFHWSVVHLQETIVLEKTDSSFPRHYQLPIVPQIEVVSTSSLYAWSFSDLQGFCSCYNTCFESIYKAALLHLEDNFMILTSCLWFLQCFSPFFYNDPTMYTPVCLSTAQYGHILRKILQILQKFSICPIILYGKYGRWEDPIMIFQLCWKLYSLNIF